MPSHATSGPPDTTSNPITASAGRPEAGAQSAKHPVDRDPTIRLPQPPQRSARRWPPSAASDPPARVGGRPIAGRSLADSVPPSEITQRAQVDDEIPDALIPRAGSFARHLRRIRWSSAPAAGSSSRGGAGSSFRMALTISAPLVRRNGGIPRHHLVQSPRRRRTRRFVHRPRRLATARATYNPLSPSRRHRRCARQPRGRPASLMPSCASGSTSFASPKWIILR